MSGALVLNAFSQRFANRLLLAHPDWRPLIQHDPEGFPPPGSLHISVPSPVAGRALVIRTSGDQLTIDFGPHGWHEHFLPAAYADEASACTAALRFIEDLLTDRQVIATRYFFGRPAWGRALEAGHARTPLLGQTRIVSWSGTQDATLSRRHKPWPNEQL
jgi:hypothetical protein